MTQLASRAVPLLLALACLSVVAAGCSSGSDPDSQQGPTAVATSPVSSTVPPQTANPTTATGAQSRSEDLAALMGLLASQNSAIRNGDFGSFYATCASSLRDSAASGQSLQALLAELPPDFDWLEFEFESVEFVSATEATVFYSIRMEGGEYFLGTSTGLFQKINGDWFSLGRGCV